MAWGMFRANPPAAKKIMGGGQKKALTHFAVRALAIE
jgi:hypothetical protein